MKLSKSDKYKTMHNCFDKHLSSAIVDWHLIALFLQTHREISKGGTNMLDI